MTYRKWTVSPEAVIDFLNNAKILGPFPWVGLPVGAKTLIFTEPVVTVTFSGAADAIVPLVNIINEIQAAVPDMRIGTRASVNSSEQLSTIQKYVSFCRDGGLVIANTGTANALFGLSTSAATTVKPPVPSASIKSMSRAGIAGYEIIVGGADADYDSPSPPCPVVEALMKMKWWCREARGDLAGLRLHPILAVDVINEAARLALTVLPNGIEGKAPTPINRAMSRVRPTTTACGFYCDARLGLGQLGRMGRRGRLERPGHQDLCRCDRAGLQVKATSGHLAHQHHAQRAQTVSASLWWLETAVSSQGRARRPRTAPTSSPMVPGRVRPTPMYRLRWCRACSCASPRAPVPARAGS